MTSSINASLSAGVVTTADTSGILQLQTASTAAVTIDASQQVGVGTASPASLLHVAGTIRTSSGANYAQFANNFLRSNASGSFFYDNATVGQSNEWRTSVSSSLDTTALTLTASGILALRNAGTSATGIGITFPATQSASSDANTLDDYEEGTWSPTLKGDNAATGQTYGNQYGYYVKVGKLVYVTYDVTLTAKGTISGNITVSSLPFTSGGYNAGNAGGSVAYWQNMNTSWNSIVCHLGQGTNFAQSYGTSGSGNTATTATNTSDLANNTRWMGMLVYGANA